MKRKNLLNETQVRKFMKLANINKDVADNFLTEGLETRGGNTHDEVRKGAPGPHRRKKASNPGPLAGKGPGLVKEDDDDEGFEAGESHVFDEAAGTAGTAGTAVAGVGTWTQDRPWGALWTTCVSIGALLSVLSAFVGIELVRTMWMWTQPGEPTSGLLGMLGGMFGK